MGRYAVLGAGPVGRAVAGRLAGAGDEVLLVSRSGRDPGVDGVRAVAGDVSDAAALRRLTSSCAGIVNAVNPGAYHRWAADWPPIAAAVRSAAEGRRLVLIGNLYAYGPVAGPMVEDQPLRPRGTKSRLRAEMWNDLLGAHAQGDLLAAEIRSSDYAGQGLPGTSMLNELIVKPLVAGRRWVTSLAGAPGALHSWTNVDDVGDLAVAVLKRGDSDAAWGRAWHTPSAPPSSYQDVADEVARILGRAPVRVRPLPPVVFAAASAVVPLLRELRETNHQFQHDFVLDDAAARIEFALTHTPWERTLAESIDWFVERRAGAGRH
ncbi:NAD-dependent epimerase/dehydratase family protein [Zhihengliuella halotolerans]|uniref:NAD-dependent epimerase/dehydratase family protein n=1 Tax=Zhihengliuella halotolerans TaxID=370736 RepID=UPI0011AF2833|nr:NAD-dependent epimerase/dehydratase family protein [Zhihengliuella halotolerans]